MVKKIVLKAIAIISAFLCAFLVYVAVQPSDYVISREISIHAPVEKVFPFLNSSEKAGQWQPWMEIDPQTAMTYSGPESGVGSKASWNGGKQLGTGSATIVESVPNQRVAIKLEYTQPMQMVQDAEYLVRPAGDETIVVWRVQGKNTFMGRLMCIFVDMNKRVGGMFEKGLSKLKTLVEKTT